MRVKHPDQPRPFRTPWVPAVPILGMVTNFALIYSLGRSNWLRLIVWLAIGQAIYFTYGRRRSRLRAVAEPLAGMERRNVI
jgi:basic amino acid/polyamine antiporter, APA family